MINESYYWKEELYKCFIDIAEFITQNENYEQSYIKIEKALMFGAYIIRKLDEAQKIPPTFMLKKEKIEKFRSKGNNVDFMNWHRIDEHYKLDKINIEERTWTFIINQLIHSYTFICIDDENTKNTYGILINSDSTKKHSLFLISFELLMKIFLSVSEGDMNFIDMLRDSTGEMKIIDAKYIYPSEFDLDETIRETIEGKIYKRLNFNFD